MTDRITGRTRVRNPDRPASDRRPRSDHPSTASWPVLAAVAALLAACGGGGSDGAGATAGGTAGTLETDTRRQVLTATATALPDAPSSRLSGNVVCDNWRIGAVTVDNVTVPAGAACLLDGTVVRGSVQAQGASLIDALGVRVAGSVQSERGAHLALRAASAVTGDVQLADGGSAVVRDSAVRGSIQIQRASGTVAVLRNTVGGNVQLFDGVGGGEIADNLIDGNLQCKGNRPPPLATGNRAASLEDQCAGGGGTGDGGGGGGGGSGGGTVPLSGNVTCRGLIIGAVSLDSVIVPAGESCTLLGTSLIGSIEVGSGATLAAEGVAVNGNLVAVGAANVAVGGASRFGGSVQIKQGGQATILGAAITGDLQLDAMAGPLVASANRIGGNLQAVGNRGGVALSNNRMNGAMQCKENLPAPIGSGNVASIKQDQCARL